MKKRALLGAGWSLVGYGGQQALRLLSTLTLARLVSTEAFGLMALVNIFILGLELLSDVGVGPAIVQSKRGDDRTLLDTAFTVQVIRGLGLFVVSLLVAWPVSLLYHEPRLTPMIAVAGLGIIIRGFTPTRLHTLSRKVMLGRLTVMEFTSQLVSIGLMVFLAWLTRSVWALLIGTLLGDFVRVVLSYIMLPGHRHRFVLDRTSVQEIVHVGRWILVSTSVTFVAGQLDRLTLGKLLSVAELGVYTAAYNMVGTVASLGKNVGGRVVFPLLAETARESPAKLYPRLRRARAMWILPTVGILVVLAIGGDWVIRLLYPAKFQEAGWMLQVLAVGTIPAVLNSAGGVVWPVLGEFRTITVVMVFQIVVLFTSMYLGKMFFGTHGVIAGIALVELIVYPFQSILIARRKLWQPELELPVLVVSLGLVTLGIWLRS